MPSSSWWEWMATLVGSSTEYLDGPACHTSPGRNDRTFMSATPLPSSHADFYRSSARSHILGGHDVRRGLEALLRRRVPSQEVEDVAQTVLADALAAATVPND